MQDTSGTKPQLLKTIDLSNVIFQSEETLKMNRLVFHIFQCKKGGNEHIESEQQKTRPHENLTNANF